jgi:imidazolonepropionase-like amidohydrolase
MHLVRSFVVRFLSLSLFLHSLGAQTSGAAASPVPARTIALKAARLFDGKSKTLMPNGVVIVDNNKITAAGSNLQIPEEAEIIDLGDATLSPGFMDAHTHLTFDFSGNYNERRLRSISENVSQLALETIPNAKATIDAGFTTVRDVGSGFPNSHDFPDVSLRNAINEGIVPGPRMLVATHGVGATGGHFDWTNGYLLAPKRITAMGSPMDRKQFAKQSGMK